MVTFKLCKGLAVRALLPSVCNVFQGSDVRGIHGNTSSICAPHSVSTSGYVKVCKCLAFRVPLPSLSPFSVGMTCVVYMETRAYPVSLCGYVQTLQMSSCQSPFTLLVPSFPGGDMCGIHGNTSSIFEPHSVSFSGYVKTS